VHEPRRGRPRDARAGMKGTRSCARRGEGLGGREGGRGGEGGKGRESVLFMLWCEGGETITDGL